MTYDLIGTIHKPTGVMLTDSEGFEYPEMEACSGYHVNVLELTPELQPYVVTPDTPVRKFAGRDDTICLQFANRDEWLSLEKMISRSLDQLNKEAERAIQEHINTTVKDRGYDNENSIAKYLVDGNPFYAECKAISLWIGSVWTYTHQVQADVQGGIRPLLTIQELIAELPTLEV